MADREVKTWVTINGAHVPIYEGDSKQDVINRAIAKRNEEIKEKQIARNSAQASQLKQSSPSRTLRLANIPAEEANKTTTVKDLQKNLHFKIKDGTNIVQVIVFAGKGCSKVFRNAEKYAKRWGGKAEDWQHVAGKAQITDGHRTLTREIHWVQNATDGKMREAFIKYHEKQGGQS